VEREMERVMEALVKMGGVKCSCGGMLVPVYYHRSLYIYGVCWVCERCKKRVDVDEAR